MSTVLNYKASPTAVKFHQSKAFVRGIRGPFGCVRADTKVWTENGLIPISDIDRPMRVLSWNERNNQFELCLSGGAYRKGRDYLYRVVTQRGEFVASGNHQLLSSEHTYLPVESLYPGQSVYLCSDAQQRSNDEMCRLLSEIDAPHCSQTDADYLENYASSARLYGQQRLKASGSVQVFPQEPADAQLSRPTYAHEDDQEGRERLHNRLSQHFDHVSIDDLSCLEERHVCALEGCASSRFFSPRKLTSQYDWQYRGSLKRHQPDGQQLAHSGSYPHSFIKDTIMSVERLQKQEEYWDLQVAFNENYVDENGFVHHNSGKSVACCWEIFMKAKMQAPSRDGIRRTRWIVARNTQPQLETTTIKTWLDWFPENTFGKMSRKPPFTHLLKFADVECEVIFLALDRPEDLKKLLSFEVTGVWFNEAREIDYELVMGATGRVGRYPSVKDKPEEHEGRWPSWHGIIMDTNPPNDEHWWYKMDVEQAWAVDRFGHPKPISEIPDNQRWEFFSQPSGLSDAAENIENLPGGKDYYMQQLGGKSKEWIKVHVHGEYGSVMHGLPVYGDDYQPDHHKSDVEIPAMQGGTIHVGVDCSGRHPAAIYAQKNNFGQIQVVGEICVVEDKGIGAKNFARLLKADLNQKFPNHSFEFWGDPAGAWGSQNDEQTYFSILMGEGINIRPSPGLRIKERIEAVRFLLCSYCHGQPQLLISPACKHLVKGFEGGYRFKKLNVSGGVRYDEKPEKNRYSDVHDALQYLACAMGGTNMLYNRGGRSYGKTKFAGTSFNVFA